VRYEYKKMEEGELPKMARDGGEIQELTGTKNISGRISSGIVLLARNGFTVLETIS
jgi:hypothetical protein